MITVNTIENQKTSLFERDNHIFTYHIDSDIHYDIYYNIALGKYIIKDSNDLPVFSSEHVTLIVDYINKI